jgi:hypothetical protein
MKIHFQKTILTIVFIISGGIFSIAAAQQIEVTGKIIDKTTNTTLPGATVMLLHPNDSTFYKFASTKADGIFSIKGAEAGNYLLQVSFIGYQSFYKELNLTVGNSLVDLGNITIEQKKELLKAVEIVEEMVPVIINGDTIEYSAEAFKTQPEANVSDLLKKLPGVEVDKDGTVTAQGEEVKKVLIDGKKFFGDDTKLATENLPADMVKKVQIYDDLSETSKITGIDDGDRTKTINLKIKKDRKKGVFGNVTAGGGITAADMENFENEKGLYSGKFNINKFTNVMQLSTLGMLNNTNEQGFSFRDYMNFAGGVNNLLNSNGMKNAKNNSSGVPIGSNNNDGFTETGAAGINLNYDLTKSISIATSYFYNQSDKEIASTIDRQNFSEKSNFNSQQVDLENQLSRNHRINLEYKQKIDSTQDLTINTNLTYSDGNVSNYSTNTNLSTEGFFLNSSETSNYSVGTDYGINGSLIYGKRFKKKGRSLVTNFSVGNANNDKNYDLESSSNYMDSITTILSQRQNEINKQTDYSGKITITEPLGKRKYLELSYQRQNYNNDYEKAFYDITFSNNEVFNSLLSLNYDNSFVYDKYGFNTKINTEKSNLTVGAAIQRSDLDGKIVATDFALRRIRWNALPRLKWNYRFNKSTRLNLNYNSFVQEPSLEQLQPTLDNSDPLNLYQGNPDLKTEYSHNMKLRLMSFNQFNFTSLFAMLNSTYTKNKITSSQTIDSKFIQTTTPINVDFDYLLTGYLHFGTPIRPIKSKIKIGVNSTFNRSILFINTDKNFVNRYTNGFNFSIENRNKNAVDIEVGTKVSLTNTLYSENKNLNQNYVSAKYYADLVIEFAKTWTFNTEVNYTTYTSDLFANNPDIPIWNAYIAKRFLKGNSGLLKLAIYDIFNENIGIYRTSEANYIQDERITTLSRYVMLSFSYKIRRFGGKKKKKSTESENK